MPIYEYACTSCGERTEAKQGFDDPPLETCEACGGKLRKLYSPVGIVFKGSGFYSTDAKKGSGSSSSSSSSGSSSGDQKKTDGGGKKSDQKGSSATTDSKPAPKAGGKDTKS